MKQRHYIGKNISRDDGLYKVTGRTKYCDDLPLSDFLWGVQVGSPVVSGKLNKYILGKDVDWSEYCICDYRDIPGENSMASVVNDLPILVEDKVLYFGQPVLLIAHKNYEKLKFIEKHVIFEIEEDKEHIFFQDIKDKEKSGKSNVFYEKVLSCGNVIKGFTESKYILDGIYNTQSVEQAYLETQSMICEIKNEKIYIRGSMQCPFYVLSSITRAFQTDPSQVEVQHITTGGAFGGKEDYPSLLAVHAALLAKKSGKTVKITYDRKTDMSVTTKRHPSHTYIKIGLSDDLKMKSLLAVISLDGGAYETLSRVVLARALLHAGAYEIENVEITGKVFRTNTPPNGAFRGFGAPQSFFMIERHLDKICRKFNLNKIELIRKNIYCYGSVMPSGQILKEEVSLPAIFEKILSVSNYKKLRKDVNKFNMSSKEKEYKGIGLSVFFHGSGFTGSGEIDMKSKAGLKITEEGKVILLTAATEMGQGSHIVLRQIVAEELCIPIENTFMEEINTQKVPNSGPTVASRTTMIVGKILQLCAQKIKKDIGNSTDSFREKTRKYIKEGKEPVFFETYQPPKNYRWDEKKFKGDAYSDYAWASYLVLLRINKKTFEVCIDKVFFVCDVGCTINPQLARGQVEGGILQAIGYSLLENISLKKGKCINADFTNYLLPTISSLPDIEIHFIENKSKHGPYGAKGLGELPLNGLPPAIANAVSDALDTEFVSLPITPEKILEKLSGTEK